MCDHLLITRETGKERVSFKFVAKWSFYPTTLNMHGWWWLQRGVSTAKDNTDWLSHSQFSGWWIAFTCIAMSEAQCKIYRHGHDILKRLIQEKLQPKNAFLFLNWSSNERLMMHVGQASDSSKRAQAPLQSLWVSHLGQALCTHHPSSEGNKEKRVDQMNIAFSTSSNFLPRSILGMKSGIQDPLLGC